MKVFIILNCTTDHKYTPVSPFLKYSSCKVVVRICMCIKMFFMLLMILCSIAWHGDRIAAENCCYLAKGSDDLQHQRYLLWETYINST